MSDLIHARLASLPKLSKPELHNLWQELFQKAPPPPQIRKDLMIPILAYQIQELAFGSLSADARLKLSTIARSFGDHDIKFISRPSIKPGTRLVRQWKDNVYVVHVEERGYEYNGSRYESLSEIARLITGTRWSGPLFFGLKGKRIKTLKEAA